MLTECLESLRGQDFPDEILVYDDASSLPASNYLAPGMNVKVIRGETNRGPSFGRNRLLNVERARTIFIFMMPMIRFSPEWCRTVRPDGGAEIPRCDLHRGRVVSGRQMVGSTGDRSR